MGLHEIPLGLFASLVRQVPAASGLTKNSSSSGHGEGSPSSGSCSTGGWDASSIAASRCPPRNPVTGYEVYTSIYYILVYATLILVYTSIYNIHPSYTVIYYAIVYGSIGCWF